MRGHQVRVSSGSLAESGSAETVPAVAGSALLASYRVPVTEERYSKGIYNHFSGTLTNSSPRYLPPGGAVPERHISGEI